MFLTLVTLVFILNNCQCKLNSDCPLPEESYPCFCEIEDGESVLYCNNLDDSDDIYKGLHKLSNYEIGKLNLFKSFVDDLPSNIFQGLHIKRIVFERSVIPYKPPQFLGLENSLTAIEMNREFRKDHPMNKWSIGHLKNLKSLTIEDCQLPKIQNDWIQSSAPNLIRLSLEYNEIEILEDKVFVELESVITISLGGNKITELKRSMFPFPAINLRILNLNDNNIQSLPNDIFNKMDLRLINLHNNKLITLEESTWKNVMGTINQLYLEDNPFHCNRSLIWLTNIRFPAKFEGKCATPQNLRGKDLKLLKVEDLN